MRAQNPNQRQDTNIFDDNRPIFIDEELIPTKAETSRKTKSPKGPDKLPDKGLDMNENVSSFPSIPTYEQNAVFAGLKSFESLAEHSKSARQYD